MLPQNRFRYFNPSAPSARIMPELPTNSAEEPKKPRLWPFLPTRPASLLTPRRSGKERRGRRDAESAEKIMKR